MRVHPIARCIDISSATKDCQLYLDRYSSVGPTHLRVVLHGGMVQSAADTNADESKIRKIDNREDVDILTLVTSDSEVAVDN